MKPKVPEILSKFFRKCDPQAFLHEVSNSDLPALGSTYRDNTSGIVWGVLAHAGPDKYQKSSDDDQFGYQVTTVKERKIILTAIDHDNVVMHISLHDFNQDIPASDHYQFVRKDAVSVKRFEPWHVLDDIEFCESPVKEMSIEKVYKKLNNPETVSLHVVNVNATAHGLADLFIEFKDERSGEWRGEKIKATWIPQDLLKVMSKKTLLESITFRKMIENGLVVPITKGSVKRIMETPEYAEELERIENSYRDVLSIFKKESA